ncbi:hypothetical protein GCK72_025002 [Caenorhabditis remanei]|uniref:3-oxo-5alpha-steroid 4-dehydrogenase (NADP(+)) n=1 Tax=Caenorhabditis remanei TaxID=31234 RepID=E3MRQ2_CAERE|nr:hypothetical protein GCK72_025002 [Caenorhabditis remanei]EFP08076.1 hypothetical protein CRE_14788 [Caenorhabditis remanei]KAF1748535.1 hypothetical protein GCK72_025002 [Caenorhabditis remanei]
MRELILTMAWLMIISAVLVFLALRFGLTAGYGRYTNVSRFGLNPKLAWFIQEAPSFFIPVYCLFIGTNYTGHHLTRLFLIHYINRVFVFPFRIRSTTTSPLYIMASAVFFCTYNGFMQGVWNSFYQEEEPALTARHYIGSALYFYGMYINHKADKILFNLRAPGETGYKIPTGWLYEHISCPNYFGEIVEWTGYAIIAWNLPALAFAIFTASNIGPRALSHHAWYKEKFPEYPPHRKALIPFLL